MSQQSISFLTWCFVLLFFSCGSGDSKEKVNKGVPATTGSPKGAAKLYDLSKPVQTDLPETLNEISGLSYNEADSSLYAISDDDGYLYRIDLKHGAAVQRWKFHKKEDFEDLYYLNGKFYIQDSNGDMYVTPFDRSKLPPDGTSIASEKYKWAFGNNHELESLYYDDKLKNLISICKSCDGDKKKSLSVYTYDPQSNSRTENPFQIDVNSIDGITGDGKIKFKPSAATIQPQTGDIYILSAINHLLVVADRKGVAKDYYRLDEKTFKHPEGIAFTPDGNLFISNEAANAGPPNILFFKRQ